MGFGTFFIGYFLLLDISYYLLTDLIAAAVMMLGLARLSRFNRGFKAAFCACGIFVVFALAEFGVGIYDMLFSSLTSPSLVSYLSMTRSLLLAILTFTAFEGMRDVSEEVGLTELAKKCKITSYLAVPIYLLAIIAETPSLFAWTSVKTATVIAVVSLLICFVFVIVNLFTVYTCYAKICMPDEVDNETKQRDKKDGFLASYNKRQEEARLEYAEYKLEKLKKNKDKKKK